MAIKWGIFFTLGTKVIRLPINPETLPDVMDGNNEAYNVLGIGEITRQRRPLQRVIEISSYFPAKVTSSVLTPNQFMTPEDYIQFFRGAMENKSVLTYTPVRYLEDGTPYDISDTGFKVTVESFSVEERGGETGDFYYTLNIKEYRDYSPITVKVQTQPASAQNTQETKTVTQEKTRSVPKTEIVVGSICEANGNFYYTSYAEEPHGTASGRRCIVKRIVDKSRKAPYNVKGADGRSMGWIAGSALTVVENNV